MAAVQHQDTWLEKSLCIWLFLMLPTWLSGRSELEVSRHFSLAASGFAGRVLRNGSCGGADGPLSVADLGIFSIMEKLGVSSEEQLLWAMLPH